MTTTDFNLWAKECTRFEKWCIRMGIDISNPKAMQNAFTRIEGKNVSLQNPIHKLLN